MHTAISSEVQDLLRKGIFQAILKEELLDGATAPRERFVPVGMSNADEEVKFNARYVIESHRTSMKSNLVHRAQTLQAYYARLLLELAPMFKLSLWSSDVKLAYLQSIEPRTGRVFIKDPAPEFELEPDECFELLCPLYELADGGDLWHKKLRQHLPVDLGLQPTKADLSLYFSFRKGELVGTMTHPSMIFCERVIPNFRSNDSERRKDSK